MASLVRKLQGSVLIKFKAGMINHIPQGMWLLLRLPQYGAHQSRHVGQGDRACLGQLHCSGHFFTLAPHPSLSDTTSVSEKGNSDRNEVKMSNFMPNWTGLLGLPGNAQGEVSLCCGHLCGYVILLLTETLGKKNKHLFQLLDTASHRYGKEFGK